MQYLLLILVALSVILFTLIYISLSNSRKLSNNRNNFDECFNYMNKNWENFESRYGHLSDEIIRRQLFPTLKEVSEKLTTDQCIYDIGGNIGEITNLFHEYYPDNEIYTFEPVISNFKELKRKFINIDNIKLNNIALGSLNGEKTSHTINNGRLGDYLYPRRMLSEFLIKYMTVDMFYQKFCILSIFIF